MLSIYPRPGHSGQEALRATLRSIGGRGGFSPDDSDAMRSFDLTEILLQRHFELEVHRALLVNPADGPVIPQIQHGIRRMMRHSRWIFMIPPSWPSEAIPQPLVGEMGRFTRKACAPSSFCADSR